MDIIPSTSSLTVSSSTSLSVERLEHPDSLSHGKSAPYATRDWDAIMQRVCDIQEIIHSAKRNHGKDLSFLPPDAATAVKDLAEGQARIAASSSNVLEFVNTKLRDFAEVLTSLKNKAQFLDHKNSEIDRKLELLLMPEEDVILRSL